MQFECKYFISLVHYYFVRNIGYLYRTYNYLKNYKLPMLLIRFMISKFTEIQFADTPFYINKNYETCTEYSLNKEIHRYNFHFKCS